MMLLEHRGQRPRIHASAYVAPNATICGDVTIGAHSRILFGAVIVAEGGPVEIGAYCVIMEQAVIRGTPNYPTSVGEHSLVGPHAYLTGCVVAPNVFLATGVKIFTGAQIGTRAEVRINAVVHLQTIVPPDTTVPIGWVAVGNPAEILPPHEHDRIWQIQEPLNFAHTVFGVTDAPSGDSIMPELTRRYTRALSAHWAMSLTTSKISRPLMKTTARLLRERSVNYTIVCNAAPKLASPDAIMPLWSSYNKHMRELCCATRTRIPSSAQSE